MEKAIKDILEYTQKNSCHTLQITYSEATNNWEVQVMSNVESENRYATAGTLERAVEAALLI